MNQFIHTTGKYCYLDLMKNTTLFKPIKTKTHTHKETWKPARTHTHTHENVICLDNNLTSNEGRNDDQLFDFVIYEYE